MTQRSNSTKPPCISRATSTAGSSSSTRWWPSSACQSITEFPRDHSWAHHALAAVWCQLKPANASEAPMRVKAIFLGIENDKAVFQITEGTMAGQIVNAIVGKAEAMPAGNVDLKND